MARAIFNQVEHTNMAKTASFVSLSGIFLDREGKRPLHRQLYEELQRLILAGQLQPGTRLPPTRTLSKELNLSRSTVMQAINQLTAEGYIQGRVGAGTFVSCPLPESMLRVSASGNGVGETAVTPSTKNSQTAPRLSKRGQRLIQEPPDIPDKDPVPFRPGIPEINQFPFNIWRKLMNKHWHSPAPQTLSYNDPAGYMPLREAIASHARTARGIRCTPEQVIMVSGTQQALHLIFHILTDPGDPVWIENPGYSGAKRAIQAAEAQFFPVPIDKEGLDVSFGIHHQPNARLAYTCPSHQYPIGVTMSMTRRLQLLQWAQKADAWIIEDDYDSEYRFSGHPFAALQGLDNAGRVLYIGTFSKVLFPGLRLGYLIVPQNVREAFVAARAHFDRSSPWITQMVLNEFIREGHFARHIRKMRTLYAHRQRVLIGAIEADCADWLTVDPAPAGLHMLGWLNEGVDDTAVSAKLLTHGIDAPSLSSYSLTPLARGGLVLGYGALDEGRIRAGIKRMAAILNS